MAWYDDLAANAASTASRIAARVRAAARKADAALSYDPSAPSKPPVPRVVTYGDTELQALMAQRTANEAAVRAANTETQAGIAAAQRPLQGQRTVPVSRGIPVSGSFRTEADGTRVHVPLAVRILADKLEKQLLEAASPEYSHTLEGVGTHPFQVQGEIARWAEGFDPPAGTPKKYAREFDQARVQAIQLLMEKWQKEGLIDPSIPVRSEDFDLKGASYALKSAAAQKANARPLSGDPNIVDTTQMPRRGELPKRMGPEPDIEMPPPRIETEPAPVFYENVGNGMTVEHPQGRTAYVNTARMDNDGNWVYSPDYDNPVMELVRTRGGGDGSKAPEDRVFVARGEDGTLMVFNGDGTFRSRMTPQVFQRQVLDAGEYNYGDAELLKMNRGPELQADATQAGLGGRELLLNADEIPNNATIDGILDTLEKLRTSAGNDSYYKALSNLSGGMDPDLFDVGYAEHIDKLRAEAVLAYAKSGARHDTAVATLANDPAFRGASNDDIQQYLGMTTSQLDALANPTTQSYAKWTNQLFNPDNESSAAAAVNKIESRRGGQVTDSGVVAPQMTPRQRAATDRLRSAKEQLDLALEAQEASRVNEPSPTVGPAAGVQANPNPARQAGPVPYGPVTPQAFDASTRDRHAASVAAARKDVEAAQAELDEAMAPVQAIQSATAPLPDVVAQGGNGAFRIPQEGTIDVAPGQPIPQSADVDFGSAADRDLRVRWKDFLEELFDWRAGRESAAASELKGDSGALERLAQVRRDRGKFDPIGGEKWRSLPEEMRKAVVGKGPEQLLDMWNDAWRAVQASPASSAGASSSAPFEGFSATTDGPIPASWSAGDGLPQGAPTPPFGDRWRGRTDWTVDADGNVRPAGQPEGAFAFVTEPDSWARQQQTRSPLDDLLSGRKGDASDATELFVGTTGRPAWADDITRGVTDGPANIHTARIREPDLSWAPQEWDPKLRATTAGNLNLPVGDALDPLMTRYPTGEEAGRIAVDTERLGRQLMEENDAPAVRQFIDARDDLRSLAIELQAAALKLRRGIPLAPGEGSFETDARFMNAPEPLKEMFRRRAYAGSADTADWVVGPDGTARPAGGLAGFGELTKLVADLQVENFRLANDLESGAVAEGYRRGRELAGTARDKIYPYAAAAERPDATGGRDVTGEPTPPTSLRVGEGAGAAPGALNSETVAALRSQAANEEEFRKSAVEWAKEHFQELSDNPARLVQDRIQSLEIALYTLKTDPVQARRLAKPALEQALGGVGKVESLESQINNALATLRQELDFLNSNPADAARAAGGDIPFAKPAISSETNIPDQSYSQAVETLREGSVPDPSADKPENRVPFVSSAALAGSLRDVNTGRTLATATPKAPTEVQVSGSEVYRLRERLAELEEKIRKARPSELAGLIKQRDALAAQFSDSGEVRTTSLAATQYRKMAEILGGVKRPDGTDSDTLATDFYDIIDDLFGSGKMPTDNREPAMSGLQMLQRIERNHPGRLADWIETVFRSHPEIATEYGDTIRRTSEHIADVAINTPAPDPRLAKPIRLKPEELEESPAAPKPGQRPTFVERMTKAAKSMFGAPQDDGPKVTFTEDQQRSRNTAYYVDRINRLKDMASGGEHAGLRDAVERLVGEAERVGGLNPTDQLAIREAANSAQDAIRVAAQRTPVKPMTIVDDRPKPPARPSGEAPAPAPPLQRPQPPKPMNDAPPPQAGTFSSRLDNQTSFDPDKLLAAVMEPDQAQELQDLIYGGLSKGRPVGPVKVTASRKGKRVIVTVTQDRLNPQGKPHTYATERTYRLLPPQQLEDGKFKRGSLAPRADEQSGEPIQETRHIVDFYHTGAEPTFHSPDKPNVTDLRGSGYQEPHQALTDPEFLSKDKIAAREAEKSKEDAAAAAGKNLAREQNNQARKDSAARRVQEAAEEAAVAREEASAMDEARRAMPAGTKDQLERLQRQILERRRADAAQADVINAAGEDAAIAASARASQPEGASAVIGRQATEADIEAQRALDELDSAEATPSPRTTEAEPEGPPKGRTKPDESDDPSRKEGRSRRITGPALGAGGVIGVGAAVMSGLGASSPIGYGVGGSADGSDIKEASASRIRRARLGTMARPMPFYN